MSERTHTRRTSAALAAGVIAAGALFFGPVGAANAAPAGTPQAATTAADSCTVTQAELRWGVKESFRNYISGSIANGEWTTENGTAYETPAFIWNTAEGALSPALDSGSVKFTGDVHFTGHGGLMKLDLRDPEIVFTGDDSAQLVLSMGSTDVEGAEVTYERVTAAKVDLAGYDAGDGSTFSIPSAAVTLTSEGAAALNGDYGDYIAGAEMDALALEMTVTGCDLTASTGTQKPVEETPAPEVPVDVSPVEETKVPWIPIIIGGVALAAIGVTAGMLIAGGRKKDSPEASDEAPSE